VSKSPPGKIGMQDNVISPIEKIIDFIIIRGHCLSTKNLS
jgi:hypothetical protein